MHKPIEGVTILGFGHKARNGKDAAAGMLLSRYSDLCKVYSYAQALKSFCRVMGWMTKKDGNVLQKVGTDLMRAANPNVWIDALYWRIDEERPKFALITDVRFRNEAEVIHEMGGFVVKVVRLNPDGSQYVAQDRNPNHPSEVELDTYDGWDYVVQAESGRMDVLHKQVMDVFWDVRRRLELRSSHVDAETVSRM